MEKPPFQFSLNAMFATMTGAAVFFAMLHDLALNDSPFVPVRAFMILFDAAYEVFGPCLLAAAGYALFKKITCVFARHAAQTHEGMPVDLQCQPEEG